MRKTGGAVVTAAATLRILQPGPQTTVQDLGRFGFQALGVSTCGVLDPVALRLANALVGNPQDAAALECRLAGPSFVVEEGRSRLALAGADAALSVTLEDRVTVYPAWRAVDVPAGATVTLSALRGSGCAVLAVSGGIDVPVVLGSRSTDLKAGFGGLGGRPLRPGDILATRESPLPPGPCLALPEPPLLSVPDRLRVVLGPQADAFTRDAVETFLSARYTVSHEADRMGLRLSGPALDFATSPDIVSDGIATGSIQVPGTGLPIVLLVDHQTIGGYAKIATVISADLPAVGRLLPGASFGFAAVSVEEAEAARRALERDIARFVDGLGPAREAAAIDESVLYRANLVSGVVSAAEDTP
jgi:biotin-dependent carboxylase-like uncharacterized protein